MRPPWISAPPPLHVALRLTPKLDADLGNEEGTFQTHINRKQFQRKEVQLTLLVIKLSPIPSTLNRQTF